MMQAGKQAGAWWARLLLFVVSPGLGLLLLYGCYCTLINQNSYWAVKGALSCSTWPLRKAWAAIKAVGSMLDAGWANLPLIIASRELFSLLAQQQDYPIPPFVQGCTA